jgi:hypothetical protein
MKQKPDRKYDEATRHKLAEITGIDASKFLTGQFTPEDSAKLEIAFAHRAEEAREKRAAFVALMAGALAGKKLDTHEVNEHPLDNCPLLIEMLSGTVEDMWTEMAKRNWL